MGSVISTMGFGPTEEAAIDSLRCALSFADYQVEDLEFKEELFKIPNRLIKIRDFGIYKVNVANAKKGVYVAQVTYCSDKVLLSLLKSFQEKEKTKDLS